MIVSSPVVPALVGCWYTRPLSLGVTYMVPASAYISFIQNNFGRLSYYDLIRQCGCRSERTCNFCYILRSNDNSFKIVDQLSHRPSGGEFGAFSRGKSVPHDLFDQHTVGPDARWQRRSVPQCSPMPSLSTERRHRWYRWSLVPRCSVCGTDTQRTRPGDDNGDETYCSDSAGRKNWVESNPEPSA